MTDTATDPLTPTTLQQTLDDRGYLPQVHNPGTYALRAAVPDTVDAVTEAFGNVIDETPPEATLERLADAPRVAYVGASTDVYSRLQDHVAGDARQATFLKAFPPTDVVYVFPTKSPFEQEYNTAAELSRAGWTIWRDGEVQ